MTSELGAVGFLSGIALAFLATFIARRMRLPVVPVLLAIGAIMGPQALGFVSDQQIDTFSSIGSVLLLYAIGMGMNIDGLLSGALKSLAITLLKLSSLTLLLGFVAYTFLGTSFFEAVLIGLSFSITSTAIFHRAVRDFRLNNSGEAKLLYAGLIWEDLFAIGAILVASSFIQTGSIEIVFLRSIAFFIIPLIILNILAKKLIPFLPREDEIYFLFFLALAGIILVIANAMQVPLSLAAFLAGVLSGTHVELKRVKEKINFFTSIFVTLFFLSLGMEFNLLSILEWNLLLAISIILVLSMVAKAFFSTGGLLLMGGNYRKATLLGLLMVSTGEFSMLLAKDLSPMFSFDFLSVTTAVVFFSSTLTWFTPGLYNKFLVHVRRFSKMLPPLESFKVPPALFKKKLKGIYQYKKDIQDKYKKILGL